MSDDSGVENYLPLSWRVWLWWSCKVGKERKGTRARGQFLQAIYGWFSAPPTSPNQELRTPTPKYTYTHPAFVQSPYSPGQSNLPMTAALEILGGLDFAAKSHHLEQQNFGARVEALITYIYCYQESRRIRVSQLPSEFEFLNFHPEHRAGQDSTYAKPSQPAYASIGMRSLR